MKSLLSRVFILIALATSIPSQALSVIDDRGNTVTLQQPALRVIALAPHIVEVAYAVGKGESLVGAVSYSNYPEAALQIPRVGSFKNFSVESVVRLQPDLILAWYGANNLEKVHKLQQLGYTVYWNDPKTLEGVGKSIEDIGLLLGAADSQQARDFNQAIEHLRASNVNKPAVSVFYQVWDEPLQTLNGDHLISDIIGLCGGVNIFSGAKTRAPKVSIESVLRADPEVIIASGMGEARPDWLDEWRNWPQLQAYQHQQLHFIPPELLQRHTPRVLQGAAEMCEQLDLARQVYAKP